MIKDLSSSCMMIVDLSNFYTINFEGSLRQFCKKRVQDGSSKLEIPCALYCLVLFLMHGKISEKLPERILVLYQGYFSFNYKQFQQTRQEKVTVQLEAL